MSPLWAIIPVVLGVLVGKLIIHRKTWWGQWDQRRDDPLEPKP